MGVKILVEPIGKRIEAEPGETLMEALLRSGVGIRAECGGVQTCGKCMVEIISGAELPPPTEKERKLLSEAGIARGIRLACAVLMPQRIQDVTINVPRTSLVGHRRFMEDGIERKVQLDPSIKKLLLKPERPRISDRVSDEDRLLSILESEFNFKRVEVDFDVIKELPNHLYMDGTVTAVIWGSRRVIAVEEGNTSGIQYGLAVDLGTSRITCSLIDTSSGARKALRSIENPQIAFGEDVMSRASFSRLGRDNRKRLKRAAVGGVNELIEGVCAEAQVSKSSIYEAVVVANTVMHHMLFGIDTRRLTVSPFEPSTRRPLILEAEKVGFSINPRGLVIAPPTIDVFVGSDAVADIVSTGLHQRRKPTLLLDIGTNTEVMLGGGGSVMACSCASGPAFEGFHIEHGMKAVTGAIESVKLSEGGNVVKYEVIGGGEPVGICGSGIVDAVAQMLEIGVINRVGRFRDDVGKAGTVSGPRRYLLATSKSGNEITVSEKDINEVILAKAAIEAAFTVLMRMRGISPKALDRVLVAGAFGSHLDVENAKILGLLPDVEDSRVEFVGNAALTGAEAMLKSRAYLRTARKVARETEYVELATSRDFEAEFVKALRLRR